MTDYTPTTAEVRERFIDGFPMDTWAVARDECGRDFDRWLAQHDAEVAATALRDAADSVSEVSGVLSVLGVCRALRDRADRIEAGR